MAITQCKPCQLAGEFSLLLPTKLDGTRERDQVYVCDKCGHKVEPTGKPLNLEKLIKSYGKDK